MAANRGTSEFDVVVIGAGVSGLTCAIRLAEAGSRVTVWTSEPPRNTTSFAAGAVWGPYLVEPANRVDAWSSSTLAKMRELATIAGTGVRLVSGIEASRTPVTPPDWSDRLDDFRLCLPEELPDGFVTGWAYTTPSIDMPTYLDYLQRRLLATGTPINIRTVASLEEATGTAQLVINCAGLGTRELVPDPQIEPIRGQLVIVENPGIDCFFSEDTGAATDLLHYTPHGDTVVLGGTAQPGEWDRTPDPGTAEAIIARCARIEPLFATARVLDHRVGLRPTRPQVRVEQQPIRGGHVIHNYGHGGAGVTLSWGCANEVAMIAALILES